MRVRYGPHGNTRPGYEFSGSGELYCTVKFAPFSFKHRDMADGRVDGEEKQMALVLRQALLSVVALDRFPKAMVEVHLCVLQSDGGTSESEWCSRRRCVDVVCL